MFNVGPQELLIILIILLIVVGPQRLPEFSRQIGRGLREFRKVQDEVKGMVKLDLDADPDRPKSRPATPTAPGVHRTSRPAAPVEAPAASTQSDIDGNGSRPGPEAAG
jgi:sec-independent protein translocase protein TatA